VVVARVSDHERVLVDGDRSAEVAGGGGVEAKGREQRVLAALVRPARGGPAERIDRPGVERGGIASGRPREEPRRRERDGAAELGAGLARFEARGRRDRAGPAAGRLFEHEGGALVAGAEVRRADADGASAERDRAPEAIAGRSAVACGERGRERPRAPRPLIDPGPARAIVLAGQARDELRAVGRECVSELAAGVAGRDVLGRRGVHPAASGALVEADATRVDLRARVASRLPDGNASAGRSDRPPEKRHRLGSRCGELRHLAEAAARVLEQVARARADQRRDGRRRRTRGEQRAIERHRPAEIGAGGAVRCQQRLVRAPLAGPAAARLAIDEDGSRTCRGSRGADGDRAPVRPHGDGLTEAAPRRGVGRVEARSDLPGESDPGASVDVDLALVDAVAEVGIPIGERGAHDQGRAVGARRDRASERVAEERVRLEGLESPELERREHGVDRHRVGRAHHVGHQTQARGLGLEACVELAPGRVEGSQVAIAEPIASGGVLQPRVAAAGQHLRASAGCELELGGELARSPDWRFEAEALLQSCGAVAVPLDGRAPAVLDARAVRDRQRGGDVDERVRGARASQPQPDRTRRRVLAELEALGRESQLHRLIGVARDDHRAGRRIGSRVEAMRAIEGVRLRAQRAAQPVGGRSAHGGRDAQAQQRRGDRADAAGDREQRTPAIHRADNPRDSRLAALREPMEPIGRF
jgi:hypothetical protein